MLDSIKVRSLCLSDTRIERQVQNRFAYPSEKSRTLRRQMRDNAAASDAGQRQTFRQRLRLRPSIGAPGMHGNHRLSVLASFRKSPAAKGSQRHRGFDRPRDACGPRQENNPSTSLNVTSIIRSISKTRPAKCT